MENKIIAFFDYNCPFCYIGFSIIEELKYQYKIECIYKACELYPQIQPGGISKEDCLHGYDIDSIYNKLRKIGNKNSLEFGDLDRKYNSHKSLLLAEFAQNNNKITEFSRAIYEKYYNFDKDISDDILLREIYNNLNLDYDYAIEQINNGSLEKKLKDNMDLKAKLNIEVLPTYIINEENILNGILTKNKFLKIFKSYN